MASETYANLAYIVMAFLGKFKNKKVGPFAREDILRSIHKWFGGTKWTKEMETTGMINIDFTDQGYRVVKGKFVWEEK